VLRRPDEPRHAHRLVHRHVPPHRAGLAAAHSLDDIPSAQWRARRRQRTRPVTPSAVPRVRRRSLRMELDSFRTALDRWLDEHTDELAPTYAGAGTLDDEVAQLNKVKRLTYDAGWIRYGWPERVGG